MRLSLVIPVYNEAGHLHNFLRMIDALSLDNLEKELIFVDDASKDGSLGILRAYAFETDKVQIHSQPLNQGKGSAVRVGIQAATGDFIVVQDADFEYDPRELKFLLLPLLEDRADVVYGSRFKKTSTQVHRTFHYIVNRALAILSNALSGLYLSDMETCYKLFRSEILKNINLESQRFGFEPEVTAKIARLKLRVHEFGISYHPRNYIDGKKITWRDGLAALWQIFYYNVLAPKEKFFKKEMPPHYLPKSAQWL